ncbi:MAG: response regulator [Proteobacteria bacterium]|nr:MAG: response regulator [Pseudomonadota bacterium]
MSSSHKLKLNEYFLLIDDDPVYRIIMTRAAELEDLRLDAFESIADIGVTGRRDKYTAALIDFDLGLTTGVETVNHLQTYFGDIPMILISAKDREPSEGGWPANIKRFLKKSQGYAFALQEARKFSELDGVSSLKVRSPKR